LSKWVRIEVWVNGKMMGFHGLGVGTLVWMNVKMMGSWVRGMD